MWVRAKEKTQLSAVSQEIIITQSVQEGSKWLAFFEPEVVPSLPWRVNHKHLNIRISEDRFKELFEEIHQASD